MTVFLKVFAEPEDALARSTNDRTRMTKMKREPESF